MLSYFMIIYNTIGVMSGTSLDGLDIVYVQIIKDKKWSYQLKFAKTYSYNKSWLKKLSEASILQGLNLIELNIKFGQFIGSKINDFIKENKINKKEINLISSHGHTVYHQPKKGFTYQIGCGKEISIITNITSVSDFRSLDVAHGGQGAPLVPIGDLFLFNDYEYCLNIGGIANISYDSNKKRIAGDIDFANINSNRLSRKLGHTMDENGNLAMGGEFNEPLFNELRNCIYYQQTFPKSLGIEDYFSWYEPILKKHNISINDQLHTAGILLCENIKKLIESKEKNKLLITGGGAFNSFWIQTLKSMKIKVVLPEKATIDYKEAIIFAFLGLLKLNNQVNTLCSVTGAKKDLKSGIVFNPKNF